VTLAQILGDPTAPGGLPAAVGAAALIAAAGWRFSALTASGAAAAFLVGAAAYGFGGLAVAAPLIAFFVTGTLLSKLRSPRAVEARAVAYKGSTRDAAQVLANGGAAAACAIAGSVFAGAATGASTRWLAAAVGAIAVATADTWATELGALSPSAPRSIATWRSVRPGASGGVTLLGFAASAAGGALIGAVVSAFAPRSGPAAWQWIALCTAVGFAGAALDSVLGATVQGVWQCDACDEPCEGPTHRCGAVTRHVGGALRIDNDTINALATAAGAALGYCVFPPAW